MIAIDTETTGLDLYHGARPFFVTICDEGREQTWWEWDVNPLTREPLIPPGDVAEIERLVLRADWIVGQNIKFDVAALRTIGVCSDGCWPWDRTLDTLLAGHLLYSNRPHNLTDMVMQYLGLDIEPLEKALGEVTKMARRWCRSNRPDWRIAKASLPDMPSARDETWKIDTWLPRAVALLDPVNVEIVPGHREWNTLLRDYANSDSASVIPLYRAQRLEMDRRGLGKLYRERLRLLPIICEMERRGVTCSASNLETIEGDYRADSERLEQLCVDIAATYTSGGVPVALKMPKGSNNKSLVSFVFERGAGLGLEPVEYTDRGSPSLNKASLEVYETTLPRNSKALTFIKALRGKRKRDTSLSYLESYRRFWLPLKGVSDEEFRVLHPSFNPTGTDTLRWSCQNPNLTQVSKQEIEEGSHRNVRCCFGPAPNREWWSLDAKNIEARLPAYASGEAELIALYERPHDPPYYGSSHLLNFSTVYADIWERELAEVGIKKVGPHIKKKYAGTWYQWCKNGGFACVPMETRALTRDGWRTCGDLRVGDLVLGYGNGKLQWTPVLDKVMFGGAELVELKNNHFRAVSTPNHRWLGKRRTGRGMSRREVEEFVCTEDITTSHTLYLSAETYDVSRLDISDEEAAIIGFAYSDGSVVKSVKGWGPSRGLFKNKVGFRVRFYQSKEEGIRYINGLLSSWGQRFTQRTQRRGGSVLVWDLCPRACRSVWKRAGLWDEQDFEQFVLNLGTSQRRAFLDAVFVAEGSWDNRGNTRLFSQNAGGFARGIKLAIFLNGKFPTVQEKKTTYDTPHTNLGLREGKPYVTGQRLVKSVIPGRHDVWCVRTALDTWVIQQGEHIMLTGNCQYGAIDPSGGGGTADRAFHRRGSHALLKTRFRKLEGLNRRCIVFAEKHGYVETMPDRSVDPEHGYPLLCTRTERGRILPTVPLNYVIQGTAMWWTCRALVRCEEQLAQWRREGFDGYITLYVHDELVFDFPRSRVHPRGDHEREKAGVSGVQTSNLWRVRVMQSLMEMGGKDVGVPTPVGVEYHLSNWGEGETL